MNNELVGIAVECRRGFNACDVGAMAKLGLSVATPDGGVMNQRHPLLALFLIGQGVERGIVHSQRESNTRSESLEVVEPPNLGVLLGTVVGEEFLLVVVEKELHATHHVLLHFFGV